MEIANLSDFELLEVFKFLSAAQLLGCRTVCRRWRRLALDPLLWKNKKLSSYGHSPPSGRREIVTALRVAPCLRSLELYCDLRETIVEWGLLVSSTRCAISEVKISFRAVDALFASTVLSRQVSLGSLKRIYMSVHAKKPCPSQLRLRALLKQVALIQGLESFKIDGFYSALPPDPAVAQLRERDAVPATLRHLEYGEKLLDPYLPLHLEWHAATLEDVTIMADTSDPRVAPLLATMPRLRALRCTMLENMEALVPCPSLRTLHLFVNLRDSNRHRLPGVRAFLASAVSHVEKLVLQFRPFRDDAEAVGLVLCLGGDGEGATALRCLEFLLYGYNGGYYVPSDAGPPPQLVPLAQVLRRMPHLTSLAICGAPSDAFLEALDGQVVPALVKLEVYQSDPLFPHDRAHGDQVRMLLQRYPRLHFVLNESRCDYVVKPCCPDFITPTYTVFSHPKGLPCDVEHRPNHYEIVLT